MLSVVSLFSLANTNIQMEGKYQPNTKGLELVEGTTFGLALYIL